MSVARGILMVLGVVTCALAGKGILYNVGSAKADFSPMAGQFNAPYFYRAFYTMSALCVICYLVLMFVGIQFIRGKSNIWPLLGFILIVELYFQFSIGTMWLSSKYGMSIAAATGVANGGMMYQVEWYFPLWAPVVAYFVSRRLEKERPVAMTATAPS